MGHWAEKSMVGTPTPPCPTGHGRGASCHGERGLNTYVVQYYRHIGHCITTMYITLVCTSVCFALSGPFAPRLGYPRQQFLTLDGEVYQHVQGGVLGIMDSLELVPRWHDHHHHHYSHGTNSGDFRAWCPIFPRLDGLLALG